MTMNCVVCHPAQILRIARDVYVVQRGLNLIKEAERRGVDAGWRNRRDSDQPARRRKGADRFLMTLPGGETSISIPDSSTFASSDRYSRA